MSSTEIDKKSKMVQTMSETNLKPSFLPSLYNYLQEFKEKGLEKKDMITLIQSRTKPRLTRKQIENALNALQVLERDILKNAERR